jgi:hypothetical protein
MILNLEGDDSIIWALDFYVTQKRLGSLEYLSATHTQKVSDVGIYSMYFEVIGKGWYRRVRPNYSHDRVVQNETVVK